MTLQIAKWKDIFENHESRKLNTLKWVAMPNRMNTQGYTALVDHPNGAAHFGAWCAIVEICSAREPKELRGTLPEGDGTLKGIARVLGRISRLPPAIFEELLPRLLNDPEIKWLEHTPEAPGESPAIPGESPDVPARKGRGGEGIEGEDNEPPAAGAALFVVPANETSSNESSMVRSDVPPAKKARRGHRSTEEIRAALGAKRLPWWEHFWGVYPSHEGLNPAMDAYERMVASHDLAVEIYRGAQRYAAKINADPTAKVKYAQGWLNSERWKDEIDARASPPPTLLPHEIKRQQVIAGLEILEQIRRS